MKVVLVTGAASGIGLALSTVCLNKGFKVILVDKDKTKLDQETIKLNKQFPQQALSKICDLTQPQAVTQLAQDLYQDLPHIDWIFNNADFIASNEPCTSALNTILRTFLLVVAACWKILSIDIFLVIDKFV